jgi:conjugal transfer pilus assembly protein TrbC
MKSNYGRLLLGILALILLFATILTAVDALSISSSDVTDAFQRSEEFEDKIEYNNKHTEEMKKEAEKTLGKFRNKVLPEVNKWKEKFHYDGNRLIFEDASKSHPEKENSARDHLLADDERIYVFISSSIPKKTLINYAASIDRLKDSRIIMVLRGCINGCSKLMPTAHFVKSIVAPSEKEQFQVEVQIDPNLFHFYDVKLVPGIIFASGVRLDVDEGSEGNTDHLISNPTSYSVYGDVSLDYAVEKINSRINNPRLLEVVRTLRSGWYGGK